MSIFPSPGSLQHPSWHCWALKPSQVPASPELPCDISKEAFTQENILCSQISLKAGWCPSNGLVLGLAVPAHAAPTSITVSAQRPSFCPAGCCPLTTRCPAGHRATP